MKTYMGATPDEPDEDQSEAKQIIDEEDYIDTSWLFDQPAGSKFKISEKE